MSVFRITMFSIIVFFAALQFISQGSLIADDSERYDSFKDCLTIKDKAVRFVCYETFAHGKVFSQKKAVVEQKKAFGTGKKTSIDTMTELTVTIREVKKSTSGALIFTTNENQIWKQKSTGRFRNVAVPFQATIKKKLISGYLLSPVGSNASVTVVRVK